MRDRKDCSRVGVCSLKNLKKQFTEAKAARAAAAGAAESADPLEWGRILTEADFERIKFAGCPPPLPPLPPSLPASSFFGHPHH